jgi:hypothetical protein
LRVPNANITCRTAGYVNLEDYGPGERLGYGESHVGDVGYANVARISDFDYRLRAIDVFKCRAGT